MSPVMALTLTASPLVPGEPGGCLVVGAAPGEPVVVMASTTGIGVGPCPPQLGGLCLDLLPPVIELGRGQANDNGEATIQWTVPAGTTAPGIVLQAARSGLEPAVSNTAGVWLSADSDGDTYLDYDEWFEGTDPDDPASRIYTGYWPFNRHKDLIPDPGWGGGPVEGEPYPGFVWPDQHAEDVALYDFLGHGRDVVIQVSAMWSSPDRAMYTWATGGLGTFGGYGPEIPELVRDARISWVVVIDQDSGGLVPDVADLQDFLVHGGPWADQVPVIADPAHTIFDWGQHLYYPWLYLVDSDGVLVENSEVGRAYAPVLDEILRRHP